MSTVPETVRNAYGRLAPNWRLEKLKFFATIRNSNVDKVISDDEHPVSLCNYTDVYYNETINHDMPFMAASATEAEIARFQLKRGQVIITKDSEEWSDIGVPAFVTEDMPDVLCGYHLAVLDPLPDLEGAFLTWLCRSDPLNDQFKLGANGVTRYGLGQYAIKNAVVALPPREAQKRIAAFLDEKTARIAALIEKKRALLDRLAEKRQAIITQAVTKGLNPTAPMKDSGIDWLGQVPAHWEVRGLTKCATRVDYRGATPEKSASGVFLVTARNIKDGKIDYKLSEEFIPDEDYEHVMRRGKPEIGDILFTTEAPLGEIANVDMTGVALAQRIIKFSSSIPNLDNYYLALWMRSSRFQFDLLSRATGSTALGIKASKIVELRCLLPPEREQRQIVQYVQAEQDKLDAVKSGIEKSMAQLGEYRSALITAAVTGLLEGPR